MIKITLRRPWQRERMNQSHNNNYEFVISSAAADEQRFFCAVLGAAGRWALCGCSGNAQTLRRSMGCHLPLTYQWWNDGDDEMMTIMRVAWWFPDNNDDGDDGGDDDDDDDGDGDADDGSDDGEE